MHVPFVAIAVMGCSSLDSRLWLGQKNMEGTVEWDVHNFDLLLLVFALTVMCL